MKRLIVNGDDFGLHPAINQGIIKAHTDGILTSASLVPCGRAFDDAVDLAKQHPELGVGIHLTFVDEIPVLPPEKIPSLVSLNGRFPKSWTGMLTRILAGRIRLIHLRREAGAQIAKVVDAGIEPTHIDSHQHLHLLPLIWRVILPLIKKHRIPAVRVIPREIIPNYRGVKSRVLEYLSKKAVQHLDIQEVSHADFAAGTSLSGRLIPNRWKSLIDNLPQGVTEVICHPAISDRDLMNSYQWGCRWEEELLALTSPEIRQMITDQQITLARHGENT
jgi:hopanoid biosynthesis associated protein HpnK